MKKIEPKVEKAWVFHDNFYGEEWKDGPSWPPHGIFCQISVSKPSKITKSDQLLWTYHLKSKFLRLKRRQNNTIHFGWSHYLTWK